MLSIVPMQKEVREFKDTRSLPHPYSGAYIVCEPLWCLWNALGTMGKQAKYIYFFTTSQFNYETLNSKSQTQTPANLFHLPNSVSIVLIINSSHPIFHNTTPIILSRIVIFKILNFLFADIFFFASLWILSLGKQIFILIIIENLLIIYGNKPSFPLSCSAAIHFIFRNIFSKTLYIKFLFLLIKCN